MARSLYEPLEVTIKLDGAFTRSVGKDPGIEAEVLRRAALEWDAKYGLTHEVMPGSAEFTTWWDEAHWIYILRFTALGRVRDHASFEHQKELTNGR